MLTLGPVVFLTGCLGFVLFLVVELYYIIWFVNECVKRMCRLQYWVHLRCGYTWTKWAVWHSLWSLNSVTQPKIGRTAN